LADLLKSLHQNRVLERPLANGALSAKPALATYSLVFLSLMVFVYEISLSRDQQEMLFLRWAAIPFEITEQDLSPTVPGSVTLTLLTAQFLHSNLLHLLGNMFYLLAFGPTVERALGRRLFLAFFLFGGILSGLVQATIYPSSLVPIVGASGSIATLMGIYVVLFPRLSIQLFLIAIWLVQELAFGPKMPHPLDVWIGGPATWSHLTGLTLGALVGLAIRKLGPSPFERESPGK
jgi:membrane associated rhomboid family serine protease